jgi:hypothetical protein
VVALPECEGLMSGNAGASEMIAESRFSDKPVSLRMLTDLLEQASLGQLRRGVRKLLTIFKHLDIVMPWHYTGQKIA